MDVIQPKMCNFKLYLRKVDASQKKPQYNSSDKNVAALIGDQELDMAPMASEASEPFSIQFKPIQSKGGEQKYQKVALEGGFYIQYTDKQLDLD